MVTNGKVYILVIHAYYKDIKMKKAIMVYRGDNPLFKALEERLGNLVDSNSIPMDDERVKDEEKKKYIKELKDKFDLVLTDNTMHVYGLDNIISIYEILGEDWIGDVKRNVDYFKEKENGVVINPYGLTHHLDHLYKGIDDSTIFKQLKENVGQKTVEELKERVKNLPYDLRKDEHDEKSYHLAELLAIVTKTKVIPHDSFFMYRASGGFANYKGKITEALKKINVEPSQAIVFVDHHIRNLHDNAVKQTEFDKVSISPICMCCIGLNDTYIESLKEHGFNVKKGPTNDLYLLEAEKKIKELVEK